jgi:hypothetical protein
MEATNSSNSNSIQTWEEEQEEQQLEQDLDTITPSSSSLRCLIWATLELSHPNKGKWRSLRRNRKTTKVGEVLVTFLIDNT